MPTDPRDIEIDRLRDVCDEGARVIGELQDKLSLARREPLGDPEHLARRFHETYERLAPEFGYQTRPESAVPWESVPDANKALMVAVAKELLS